MNVARRNQTARIARIATILGGVFLLTAFLFQFIVFSSSRDKSAQGETHQKIASSLQQKIEAEATGTVRVVIEVIPGHTGEVINRVISLGVAVEASYDNLIQALVPAALLPTIASDSDVLLVRLPMTPIALDGKLPP